MKTTFKSDNERLLEVLQARPNEWIGNLYLLNMLVHSRISDNRAKGHNIECKKFGHKDYRYRLVTAPTTPEPAIVSDKVELVYA